MMVGWEPEVEKVTEVGAGLAREVVSVAGVDWEMEEDMARAAAAGLAEVEGMARAAWVGREREAGWAAAAAEVGLAKLEGMARAVAVDREREADSARAAGASWPKGKDWARVAEVDSVEACQVGSRLEARRVGSAGAVGTFQLAAVAPECRHDREGRP